MVNYGKKRKEKSLIGFMSLETWSPKTKPDPAKILSQCDLQKHPNCTFHKSMC